MSSETKGCKLFGPQPRGWWVWVMTLVTAMYLMVEFGFNSRLLDVVGGMPNPEAVDAIEIYGRCISGFAAALMFWPTIFKLCDSKLIPLSATILLIFLISAVTIALVYTGEKKLVDSVVDGSSPNDRYMAVNLVAVQKALVVHGATLDDLPLTSAQMTEPDGKTFLAVFPLLAFSTKDLDEKIRNIKPAIFRVLVDHSYHGRVNSYNAFISSRRELINIYNNDYLAASKKYNQSIWGIGNEQKHAWGNYQRKLQLKHLLVDHIPRVYWARVREEVRDSGVPVPSNWNPEDNATFNRVIAEKIRSEADNKFRDGIQQYFRNGEPIPPNLDKNAFFLNQTVQTSWRDSLNYPNAGFILPVDLPEKNEAPAYFYKAIYNKVLDKQVQDMLVKYDAPVATFANFSPQEKMGKNGMRALAVPPIALAFSILGALVHVFKLILFILQLIIGRGFSYGFIKMFFVSIMALTFLGAFGFMHTSTITAQPLYQYFETRGAMLGGNIPTWQGHMAMFFCRSTIHAQKKAYPIFESVRKNILLGYEFGYHAD